ncbi:hypothetical protein C9374_012673 [Naegleria lovaniensis]|uniref:GATA-type domain-containing protein n=1 Tax=Naegleria lovaniensis TaxID=51637 RepID=A0AA88KQF1_NAELO|nr:uncharacterized protein C9374_012673 [Naegleria lovaniensis]KAG2392421.1 hypothetical protein C9374_012673 [Naegleria lovaniensis]
MPPLRLITLIPARKSQRTVLSIPSEIKKKSVLKSSRYRKEILTMATHAKSSSPLSQTTTTTTTTTTTCLNCGAQSSPVWRKGSKGEWPLCNKCGLYVLRYGINRPLCGSMKAGRRRKKQSGVQDVDSDPNNKKKSHSDRNNNHNTNGKKRDHGHAVDHCNSHVQPLLKKVKPSSSHLAVQPQSISSSCMSNTYSTILTPPLDHVTSSSILSLYHLKQQLEDASEKFPQVIHTLVSIIRKHVLTQPTVVSQLTTTRMDISELHKNSTTRSIVASPLTTSFECHALDSSTQQQQIVVSQPTTSSLNNTTANEFEQELDQIFCHPHSKSSSTHMPVLDHEMTTCISTNNELSHEQVFHSELMNLWSFGDEGNHGGVTTEESSV